MDTCMLMRGSDLSGQVHSNSDGSSYPIYGQQNLVVWKQQIFCSTWGPCRSGIQIGHAGDGVSLPHNIWGLCWEDCEQLWDGLIWRLLHWAEMIQRLGSPAMVYGRAYTWLLHATRAPSQHGGLQRVRHHR